MVIVAVINVTINMQNFLKKAKHRVGSSLEDATLLLRKTELAKYVNLR